MPAERQILHPVAPDLLQERGGHWLLVWGGLGQWMVADQDLKDLWGLFDGRRGLRDVLRRQARRHDKPLGALKREAAPVIEDLLSRGVLREVAGSVQIPDEDVSIANITLNLTNRCNLRCSFCYNQDHGSEDAPVELLVQGIRSGAEILDPDGSLVVLGGEPTLFPDRLLALLDGTADLFGQPPVISTNGTRITPELAQALARREAQVQVSMDSHDPAVHDAIRGKRAWERAVEGVRALVAAGCHTILSRVYGAGDEVHLEAYLDLTRELGAAEARFIPLRLIGGGTSCQAPDQRVVFEHLLALLQRRPELAPLLVRDWFSIAATSCGRTSPRVSCGIGRRVLLIDADARVYPCPNHIDPAYAAGHLGQQSLTVIVQQSTVFRKLRRDYHISRYERCAACPVRGWCAGDCRGEVLATTGGITADSPHCDEIQHLFVELFWMLAQGTSPIGQRAAHQGRTFQ